jgi:hypothetical protein
LHEGVFGAAITFGVMADSVNIICVVIQRSVRIMFEVIIIPGLGQLGRRWCVVCHHMVLPDCSPTRWRSNPGDGIVRRDTFITTSS